MASVIFSEKAQQFLERWQDEYKPSAYLLFRLQEVLQEIADHPATRTEIAKMPYASNRLMSNFILEDEFRWRWGFTITLKRLSNEEDIYLLTLNAGPGIMLENEDP